MEENKDTGSSWDEMKVKLPTVLYTYLWWMYDVSKKDLNFYPYLLKKNKLWY